MLDPLVRTYMQMKAAEKYISGGKEEIATAHLILAIEALREKLPALAVQYAELLDGQDFTDAAIAGTVRDIMEIVDRKEIKKMSVDEFLHPKPGKIQ